MTLPDDNRMRDVVTAFYRMMADYRQELAAQVYRLLKDQEEQMADLRREVAQLSNRIEILEVRQATRDG